MQSQFNIAWWSKKKSGKAQLQIKKPVPPSNAGKLQTQLRCQSCWPKLWNQGYHDRHPYCTTSSQNRKPHQGQTQREQVSTEKVQPNMILVAPVSHSPLEADHCKHSGPPWFSQRCPAEAAPNRKKAGQTILGCLEVPLLIVHHDIKKLPAVLAEHWPLGFEHGEHPFSERLV